MRHATERQIYIDTWRRIAAGIERTARIERDERKTARAIITAPVTLDHLTEPEPAQRQEGGAPDEKLYAS